MNTNNKYLKERKFVFHNILNIKVSLMFETNL